MAASAWVAAWLTVRGREMVAPRELIADQLWQGEVKGVAGSRRVVHTPDLVGIVPARRPAVIEVELARKSKARLRAILGLYCRWIASGKVGACVYVCGHGEVRKLVVAQAEQVGGGRREPSRGDVGRHQGVGPRRGQRRSTWNALGEARPVSRIAMLVDICATLALGGLGVLCACVMRRYTTLSARHLYAPAAISAAAVAAVLAVHAWPLAMVVAPPAAFWSAARCMAGGCGWRTLAPARSFARLSSRADGRGSHDRRAERASGCISGPRLSLCTGDRGQPASRTRR